jgi:hypothetical protein
MGPVRQRFQVHCCYCGQNGSLSLWSGTRHSCRFVSVGFAGLAVNSIHPEHSLMRCNSCGSSVVELQPVLETTESRRIDA